ncbi:MAG: hypothetical protein WCI77_06625 [Candidatus Omnitrophota bacterium]
MVIDLLRYAIVGFLCFFSCTPAFCAQQWQELGSDHFFVYFTQDENFAKEVSDKAEEYYIKIATDLGYPRYSQFWTWENRVKIFLYPDRDAYLKGTNQPSWSGGMADYTAKRIVSYVNSEGFVYNILPHEVAHLIFRDFVGFKGEVPLWLDEGVAQWAEPLKREKVKVVSKKLLDKGLLFSVADMINLNIREVNENDVVKINSIRNQDGNRTLLSLSGGEVVGTYYVEAVSLVDFLVDYGGASGFTEFCRQLRNGKSLQNALKSAYSTRIGSIEDLENAWLGYLRAE